MRISTGFMVLGLAAVPAFVAVPAMAQLVIQSGNPAQSDASREAAHQDMRAAHDQQDRADAAADRGDYRDAARHQDNAEQARFAAHAEHREAERSSGPTIVIGR